MKKHYQDSEVHDVYTHTITPTQTYIMAYVCISSDSGVKMHTESEPRHNLYTSIQVKQIQHVCFHACERMFNLLINEEHNVQSVIF